MGFTARAGDQTSCYICLHDIDPEAKATEEMSRELDCHHIFHRECIGEWLKRAKTCPTCRHPVEQISPLTAGSSMDRLQALRATILERRVIRRLDILDLNDNSDAAQTARRIDAIARNIIGL